MINTYWPSLPIWIVGVCRAKKEERHLIPNVAAVMNSFFGSFMNVKKDRAREGQPIQSLTNNSAPFSHILSTKNTKIEILASRDNFCHGVRQIERSSCLFTQCRFCIWFDVLAWEEILRCKKNALWFLVFRRLFLVLSNAFIWWSDAKCAQKDRIFVNKKETRERHLRQQKWIERLPTFI